MMISKDLSQDNKKKATKKPQAPYIWRRDKQKKQARPAFMQSSEDFEDDLTPYPTADMEILSEALRSRAIIISRIAAGVLALIASFCIAGGIIDVFFYCFARCMFKLINSFLLNENFVTY